MRIKSADRKENSKTQKIKIKSVTSNNHEKEDPGDLNDPTFKESLKYGWERELVASNKKNYLLFT